MDTINKPKQKKIDLVSEKSLLKLAEVSILIGSYNDIFSDFDPSGFSEKTLSDDFILQAKKISRNKDGNKMSLKLLLPVSVRNEKDEKVIIGRLHRHFKEAHQELKIDVKKTNRKGILCTFIGIVFMVIASYLSYMKAAEYHIHFLIVLFEPAGWFLIWAGLDHLVYSSKETKKELDFYSKMTKSEIKFFTY